MRLFFRFGLFLRGTRSRLGMSCCLRMRSRLRMRCGFRPGWRRLPRRRLRTSGCRGMRSRLLVDCARLTGVRA